MFFRFCYRVDVIRALAVCCILLGASSSVAFPQTARASDDEETDPIRLFERGQDAHARNDLTRAVDLYEAALKLRPEFPEAEYQRAAALIALDRLPDAEQALKRANELRSEWPLPYALLGNLLIRQKRLTDAEQALEKALKLDPHNSTALVALVDLRTQTPGPRENLMRLLGQLREATKDNGASASVWVARATLESFLGDKDAALATFDRALVIDPKNIAAHIERAVILADKGQKERAIESARTAQRLAPSSVYASSALARLYLQAGDCGEATRALDELDAATKRPSETATLRKIIAVECATGAVEQELLEKAIVDDPNNARTLSRLCVLYRKDDPTRALVFCRRAIEIEPRNTNYVTNYGAALVQARRFADAITVLERAISDSPDDYVAHTNLAIALYQLKRFREALIEYKWILAQRPDASVAYFFIATAHDNLGEYRDALSAYQTFLAHADPQKYELEISKVKLRLPGLREQIKLGQGVKKK